MKRNISILLSLCFIFCAGAKAQFVSQEIALKIAEGFFESYLPSSKLTAQALGNREQPTMYVFSTHNHWVLIAADKRVQPILAYSDDIEGVFPSEEAMPPAMLDLLEWYSEQIENLRKDDLIKESHPQWGDYLNSNNRSDINRSVIIAPLLTRNGHENIWKQSGNNDGNDIAKSYNKYCPTAWDFNSMSFCDYSLVGCVAVAVSQIMWYWQWPYVAIVKDNNGNSLLRNYEWDLMPYQLTNASTMAEADMVANLLHDVGISVNMEYGCNGSFAYPESIVSSLRDRFYYNTDDLKQRSDYINLSWIMIIKAELNALRPIAYGGFRKNGDKKIGHRFVIDGYNSDDKFHMNYGFGSGSNGYFSLDSIYKNYNYDQSMVKNIHPNYPSCESISNPIYFPLYSLLPNFICQNGGGITLGNKTINSGQHVRIISGDYIHLTDSFHIHNGADVCINIRDMHCNDERQDERTLGEPQDTYNILDRLDAGNTIANEQSSAATKLLRDGQLFIIRNGKTYTTAGALVGQFVVQ